MEKVNILGVYIDNISMEKAKNRVVEWLKKGGKHYIVTPNPEFVMAAQKDHEFKKILNGADMAIPDGVGLKLASDLESTISGVDFMEELIKLSADLGFAVGFLGGRDRVAKELSECLQKKYPKLKIAFAESGGEIDENGDYIARGPVGLYPHPMSSLDAAGTRRGTPASATPRSTSLAIPSLDILFVAFGQVKQEKWIYKNLPEIPVKVAMGVGGAFDELSGRVPRIPSWVQKIGLKWLVRLILEPRRIKRQLALLQFVWKVVVH